MYVVMKCIHENAETGEYVSWPANKIIDEMSRNIDERTRSFFTLKPSEIAQTELLDVNFSDNGETAGPF